MFKRLLGIVKKEFIELIRDKLYLTFVFVVPMVVMFLLGYGLILDVKHLPIAFLDYDKSKLSREYIDGFINNEYFKTYALVENYKTAEHLINSGKIRALIVIPQNFSRKIYKGEKTEVQILIDGTYPSRAEIVKGYVTAINNMFNQKLLENYKILKFPIEVEVRAWYNPALESKNFIMPGELVIILCFFPALLTCLVVVREKELGSILNFYVSPAKSYEIIIGKAIPYLVVSFLSYLILFFITIGIFKTDFKGNFLELSLGSFVYILSTVGLGILISTFTKTQITAMLITFIGTIIPSYLYSGYLYPVSSMGISGQIISKLIPATYFLNIVRGIYLKGLGLSFYFKDFLSLILYTLIVYLLAIWNFKKKVS
uniref:ABC transporter permease n=1 Tax=Thermodesulfobacterium geofontis TaxID=1295609 RepID=A0A7V6CDX0_9BACT